MTPGVRAVPWRLALLALLAFPAPAGAVVIDRVAAVVGGEAITRSELDQRWQAVQARPEPGAPATRAELLNHLIDMRVQMAQAREEKIQVRPEDVEDALKRIMADNGLPDLAALSSALASEGRSLEDLRREVAAQLTRMRLIQHDVTAKLRISDDVLRRAYDAHKQDYARDRQVHLRQILFATKDLDETEQGKVVDAVQALRDQITDAASFRAAEARLQDSPGVSTGEAGTFSAQDLRPELAQVLFGLKAGQISPALALPGGVGVFLVEDVTAGTPIPFSEALPKVRDRVTNDMTEARIPTWLADLKRNTHIEVKAAAGTGAAPD